MGGGGISALVQMVLKTPIHALLKMSFQNINCKLIELYCLCSFLILFMNNYIRVIPSRLFSVIHKFLEVAS